MAAPLVSWWNFENTDQEMRWDIGPVDAGSPSPYKTFLIWNNRGGQESVSDMLSCAITTKDITGGNTGELVQDKWVKVRVDTMGEVGDNFTSIGGTQEKTIKAGGGAPAGTIKGTNNDGTKENSPENFAQVTLYVEPLPTATAGNVDFLLRVTYSYS